MLKQNCSCLNLVNSNDNCIDICKSLDKKNLEDKYCSNILHDFLNTLY